MRLPFFLLVLCVADVVYGQAPPEEACLVHGPRITGGTSFELPDSIGTIRLPPGTVSEPLGENPHGRKFIFEDSTVLEIWVTPEPAAGMAAAGGMRAGNMRYCE